MNAYEQNLSFGNVIDILEAVGATYAIWGGLAVLAYGEPRFTQDMDILLSPSNLNNQMMVTRFKESHFHVDEVAVQRAMAGGFFNVIHLHYHIKTDFYVPNDPVLQAMIAERVYLPFDKIRQAAYITADSVIVAKLRAYREGQSTRHLDDIASIIRIQGKKLNPAKLDIVAAQLGLFDRWRALWEENSQQ